ncbi:hypothetical protein P153DRAFT_370464 [Dothidotthia symphoricarpi CBS 119687]|uniref:Hypersensitive response inducing protein 1 n=1 Tax=Dothidotthia symphoricarpi CBS 119687 TaxID=1392245 RepID=A0A6A6A0T6_9PLEO|nr:uncharacterized protein P153DRAFT_370464 [Dothidotthia symphoricarpi CBS 119687]KAF2125146.1 hypothetical protein P153DRAFT_370464 [Dothidotthia symphoricarpi CBS 119687]
MNGGLCKLISCHSSSWIYNQSIQLFYKLLFLASQSTVSIQHQNILTTTPALPTTSTVKMKYTTTILTFVFSSTILAAPTAIQARGDEQCTPESYTVSDYTLATSASSAYVSFNFKSKFANSTAVQDVVMNGANCQADGPQLPNSNECNVADRKLLFDLRGPQQEGYYQITHTWSCNGKTWMSGNAVRINLSCTENQGTRTCSGQTLTFAPQNVRQICSTPTC